MKTKKIFLIILILINISTNTYCQIWSVQLGGGWGDGSYTSANSLNGNTFVAGKFSGSNLITPIDTLYESHHGDLFLTNIDPNGNCIWIKQINCMFSDTDNQFGPYAIVLDENNQSVYVSIQSHGGVAVDTFNVFSYGGYDIVLAKFDFNGNCLWLKSAGGYYDDIASGLTLDSTGDIYICGQTTQGAIFDSITISSDGSYLAKYSSSGNCLWVKTISDGRFKAKLLEYNHSGLIMEGYTYDSSRVDTINLPHISGNDANVFACFDLSGNILWAKEAIIKPNSYGVYDISLDGNGNIYAGGGFKDTLELEGNLLIAQPGKSDMFMIKLDSLGNYIWSKQFNSNATGIFSISSSINGNLYITGGFRDTATFDGNVLIPNYPVELFLAHYDSNGNFHGVVHYGEAVGTSVSQDANEKPYLVSVFNNTINNGLTSYTSYGDFDLLITKYDVIDDIQNPERIANSQLVIYANPNSGKCNIQIPEALQIENELNLKIYSSSGEVLQNKVVRLNAETISIDLEYEAAGIYLVTLSAGQRVYRGKIVFE